MLPYGALPSDEDVLQAVAKACKPGRGQRGCKQALLKLQAARLLDVTPAQLTGLSPLDAMLLLLSADSAACQVSFSMRCT